MRSDGILLTESCSAQDSFAVSLSELTIFSLWPEISKSGASYTTPDEMAGADFTVLDSDDSMIVIKTTGGTFIRIKRASFISAVFFLLSNGHVSQETSCRIGANISQPAGLDAATRDHPNGTMVVSYVIPILAGTGIVEINIRRPNSTWLKI